MKTRHIRTDDSMSEKVDELMEFYSYSFSNLIKVAVNEMYERYAKQQYGYQSGTKFAKHRLSKVGQKEEQSAVLKEIRQSVERGDYEVTNNILTEIGYAKEPKALDGPGQDGWVAYQAFHNFPDMGGVGFYNFTYNGTDFRDRRYVWDLEQLIKELIKNNHV